MKFILARKENMTQFFNGDGEAFAATILSAVPLTATLARNKERDGYEATQFGYLPMKKEKAGKTTLGNTKDLEAFSRFKELPMTVARGEALSLTQFVKGDTVAVRGITKGKGFQGVVKRHGFHGGRRSHGNKHAEREPGSIGGGGRAGGRVIKGMRMAGRMGGEWITVKNLEVLDVNPESNRILVRGAIPGPRGSIIEIRG